MRRAGCAELRLGVESAANPVLYRMNKRRLYSAFEASEVVRACHAAGIRTVVAFMVGFPGEGEREFQRTCEFLREHSAQIDEVSSITTLQLLPDTPLALQAGGYGIRIPDGAGPGGWLAEGNTPEIRRDRARRLTTVARDLGLPVGAPALEEDGAGADSAQPVSWASCPEPPPLLLRLLGNLDEVVADLGRQTPRPSA
jgi:hypothetical protein